MLILAALGLISVTALNMYGGSLTLISAIDSLQAGQADDQRPDPDDRHHRRALAHRRARRRPDNFLANFNNFLLLVLYFFIPWTAVNLVDYYVVRRGHYAIAEIFNPNGMYGRWGWRGITAYLVGFVVHDRRSSRSARLYVGFIAHKLHGADISLFIGLPVSASCTTCSPDRSTSRPRSGSRRPSRPSWKTAAAHHVTFEPHERMEP